MLGMLVDSDAFGGAEVYVRQLLRRLPGDFACRLVVAEPVADHFGDLEAECCQVDVIPLVRGRADAPELGGILAAVPVDVWHVNLVDPASNRAAMAAAACAPAIATLHMPGTVADVTPELSAMYQRLSAVVVMSAEIEAMAREGLGVDPDRVVRVRGGVDIPPHGSPPARPADGRAVKIGAVGRLTERKGFDVLIEATGMLIERGFDIRVDVVGEGRDRAALKAAAGGLPVRFLGFSDDVPAFLREIDVFCLPSRREALPFALLEAMAYARPCVTTAVGDIRNALGDAVRIVPPEDPRALAEALADLIRCPHTAARLGVDARATVKRDFDAMTMAAAVVRVLAAADRTPVGRAGGRAGPGLGQRSRSRAASRTASASSQ